MRKKKKKKKRKKKKKKKGKKGDGEKRVLLRGYTNIASPRVNCSPLESYKCTACRIYFVGAHIS